MKTWCEHIEWKEMHWFIDGYHPVGRTWKRCPICEAERPTRVTIKKPDSSYEKWLSKQLKLEASNEKANLKVGQR